ncbi:MAG: HEAT repeat domain-containing protein [Planctomycetota bacterium]
MSPRRTVLVLVACALAHAPLVRAEDDPGPRRPAKPGDGFRFSTPDEPATPTPPREPSSRGPQPEPAANEPAQALIRRLATWPGQDGIKAAESLLLMGPDAVDPVRRAVAKGDSAVKPGAAWVLGKVGTTADVGTILTAAADRPNGSRLETFFEAAYELDPAACKRWMFGFLSLDRPVFRARATEFLAGVLTPEDRPRIDGLLRAPGKQHGVRMAGLELLSRTHAPDAADRLVVALGDPHPDVARRAAQLMAGLDEAAIGARLNALVREGDARERSYAMLALVERCRRTRVNAFEPATVPALVSRRGLLHPDLLCRGASAVALVFGGLDSSDPTVGTLLDHDVVTVLISTVGGDHFVDYGSVVEPAFAALRRISGEDLPATAGPWAQWWNEARGTFRARRTLTRVDDADVARARVVFDVIDAEGRRRRATFLPETAGAGTSDGFVLPTEAFRALLDAVEDAGVFQGADDQRVLTDEHLAVRVLVTNQERRLVVTPSPDDPRHGLLSARLVALEEQNLWQRYRDADTAPDARAWWTAESARSAGASPDERKDRLLALVAASFDDLETDGARLEAIDLLERYADRVSDAQANALLAWTTAQPAFGPVEGRIVAFVAALGRAELADPLVEALASSGTPEAQRLLVRTLVDAGPLRIRDAFVDPRPSVRTAGASAAADLVAGPLGRDPAAKGRLASVLGEGLRALLVDPDPVVRVRSAAGLAVLGDAKMIEKLEELYREGNTATRIAVAQSLGRVGGPSVQPTLVRLVGEVGPEAALVRAAALEAMAASGSADAVRILAFYMLNDADSGVQQAAERALTGLASDDARMALTDLLDQGTLDAAKRARVIKALSGFEGAAVRETLGRHLEDPDPRVVDEAALGLARAREGVAVTYLLAVLRRVEDPLRPRAREALEDLTSFTLPVTSYEALADQYEAWFRNHRQGGDRTWFRDAVARKGYDTTSLGGYVRGEDDLKAVPLLLRTIRDDDPVIRRNSDVALRRVSRREMPVRIERGTSREEARAVADRWAAWWARRPEAQGK